MYEGGPLSCRLKTTGIALGRKGDVTTSTHHSDGPTTRFSRIGVEIDAIPFHETEIQALQIDGKPWVILKPAFEAIGVDADRQIQKIQKQAWACTTRTAVQVHDQVRQMIAADLRTFLMALATIQASRVKPEVRPLLEAYQSEAADVIEAYFNRGMVINPRVGPEQVPAVMDQALHEYRSARERLIDEDKAERRALAAISTDQINLINVAMSTGLIDEQWGKTKVQIILARGLGEAPVIEQVELPLYVEDFMKSKGVPKAKVTRFSGAFGRKILAHAVLEGISIPGKRVQEMPDGSVRQIMAWTKEHLPLFEQAWKSSYADDERLMP